MAVTNSKIIELTCGAEAEGHLEPYLPEISGNFEIPLHIGRLIAARDNPEFVKAAAASHMREDDYVVGLVHKGVARAYPMWITDNYHVINDIVAGDPVAYVTCERCQSGSAFLATLDGRRVKFSGMGMYNATLTMIDRADAFRGGRSSTWLHYEGVALQGPRSGTFLTQIPTFHMTWKEWQSAHPETEVMVVPNDIHHRDARHGHGREEFFSRPGMDRPLTQTITGELDHRYPENEVVLGINLDQGVKAYPLREVKKAGSVVHDQFGDHPLVVFAGPHPEQFTMAAYSRCLEGRILSFRHEGNHFVDEETQSTWSIEGIACEGPLAGKQLIPLRWQFVRWHAWVYPHRGTELYRFKGDLPLYPAAPSHLDLSIFQPVLQGLSRLGRKIRIEGAVNRLLLPHEAERGVCLRVGEDRFNLYHFQTREAAEDYVTFQGAWFCLPIGTKVGRKMSCRAGNFVLESDPEVQFADPTQIVRLPDQEIRWSELVTRPELVRRWGEAITDSEAPLKFSWKGLVESFRRSGYDVIEAAFLPHGQLRVGVLNAIAATINADRFAIYKCEGERAAEQTLAEFPHAFRIHQLVFRSIPVDMYKEPFYEMGQLPDEEIHWSNLIGNDRFLNAIQIYLDQLKNSCLKEETE